MVLKDIINKLDEKFNISSSSELHEEIKIYFSGSISGGRHDADLYLQLIQYLKKYGRVLTEHIGDKRVTNLGEDNFTDESIYKRDISLLCDAHVLVAEVSTPSLGVGYEIAKAEEMKKKVLCLYKTQDNKRLSAMISGNPNVVTVRYTSFDDAAKCIDEFFSLLD